MKAQANAMYFSWLTAEDEQRSWELVSNAHDNVQFVIYDTSSSSVIFRLGIEPTTLAKQDHPLNGLHTTDPCVASQMTASQVTSSSGAGSCVVGSLNLETNCDVSEFLKRHCSLSTIAYKLRPTSYAGYDVGEGVVPRSCHSNTNSVSCHSNANSQCCHDSTSSDDHCRSPSLYNTRVRHLNTIVKYLSRNFRSTSESERCLSEENIKYVTKCLYESGECCVYQYYYIAQTQHLDLSDCTPLSRDSLSARISDTILPDTIVHKLLDNTFFVRLNVSDIERFFSNDADLLISPNLMLCLQSVLRMRR